MKRILLLLCLCLPFIPFAQPTYTGDYSEPFRPAFHFTPQTQWMNDPNGLVFLNGKYHLFYQYYPNDIVWGPMHWGHATSTDLIHWTHLPIALYPDSLGSIFSGSAVIDKTNSAGFGKNAMVAIFTYHNDEIWKKGFKNTESQGIAYSLDEGVTWKKFKGNPVLNNSGEQDFRDPKVFWNDQIGKWNMMLAVGDKIKIFSSPNLKEWSFESDFKPTSDLPELGVWECPDLFKIKVKDEPTEKWVLIVNHGDKAPNGGSGTRYFVGSFNGKTFTNNQPSLWLDGGTDFYAAVTFSNVPENKRIVLAWMSNWQYATKTPTTVWRSAMTLPRELELVNVGGTFQLSQKLVPSFQNLETKGYSAEKIQTPFMKGGLDLSQANIQMKFDKIKDLELTLANEKGEYFRLVIRNNQIITDRRHSGITDFSDSFAKKLQTMPFPQGSIESVQLILDKASVEILVNDGLYSMTNICFPNQPFSVINILTPKGTSISKLKYQSVKSIWK